MVDQDRFDDVGALRIRGVVRSELQQWNAAAESFFGEDKPGKRIVKAPALAQLANQLIAEGPIRGILKGEWRCVRAIAFNKSPTNNWALGWHQDRTVAVKNRVASDEYTVWSVKYGVPHVEPPFEVLERMVTLRVHLDAVDARNGPLKIIAGSHKLGRIAENQLESCVTEERVLTCEAKAGDAWLYSTPIIHASDRSKSSAPRRVLHLDYSRDSLRDGIEWAGVG